MKIITVGRDPENDVMIDDPHVSRQHLQIIIKDKYSIILVDSGSTNGTYVNGQKIDGRVKLFPGDVVKIGNTVLPWRSYLSMGETIVEENASPRIHSNNNPNPNYNANHASQASHAYHTNNDNGYSRANDASDSVRWNDDSPKPSNGNGMLVFFMGLIALGIDVYLVIRFFNKVSFFGGGTEWLKVFPLYLKYDGLWGWMIAALVLGGVTEFVSEVVIEDEDRLSTAGSRLAGIAITVSIIFILLAIFANSITKQLVF